MAAAAETTLEDQVIQELQVLGRARKKLEPIRSDALKAMLEKIRCCLARAAPDTPTLKRALNKVFYLLLAPEASLLLAR